MVYKNLSQALWYHAKRNVQLHLRKLADEQRLPATLAMLPRE